MSEGDARILFVEDDPQIRRRLASSLAAAGYAVHECGSVGEARVALESSFDLVLLDLGLPDQDGLDLCRELRRAGNSIPIVILTARQATQQRVRGLDLGADDYVVKPFQLDELLARIRSVLRRSGQPAGGDRLSCGDLWAEPHKRECGRGDQSFQLKPREYDLVVFLLRNPGRVWTRDQLLDRVWGPSFEGEARTVDLHVRRLRARIERDSGDPRYIKTVWGVGYRMADKP